MRIKQFIHYFRFVPFILLLLSLSYGFKGDNKKGGGRLNKTVAKMNNATSGKVGDGYRMQVNNLNIPLNSKGVIAEVTLPDGGKTNGYFGNHEFLFSGGFYLSGTRNGVPWANAVAAASLVEDYVPGTVAGGQSDTRAQLYVLNSQDQPFGQSWQDWKDAVDLGADFYDGDGDGQYNPVDLNGNGKWDSDEDSPDILGDETIWCVYNDGLAAAQRRWNTISPLGIEIRQTVFGFASAGAIGNLLFIRYRINYVGLRPEDPDTLNNVYFGVWADPDVGEATGATINLVGCDTIRNAGYTYLKKPSPGDWGNQPPCFMIDFFSGPTAYIPGVTYIDNNGDGIFNEGDTPLDSAFSIRGSLKGISATPGARNQPLSSFVEYINGDVNLSDPDNAEQARNLILGLSRAGDVVDPCNWSYGEVKGVPCADVDPRFWYSGDPVSQTGWLNTTEADIRQMSNTGPFVLVRGQEQEIVAAYVVGQGSNPLNSITVAQQIDDGAQFIFDQNFVAPSPAPAINPEVSTGENFIDLSWNTAPQVSFVDSTEAYNNHFQGYNIYAYKSNTTATTVNNEENRVLVARYTLDNFIQDVYNQNSNTGGIELLYPAPDADHQLNRAVYSDPQTGRIRLRITQDPFTGGPLIKGKPYYFSVTSYSLNYYALVYKADPTKPLGTVGDYYVGSQSFVGLVENIPKITTVTMASDLYSPPGLTGSGEQVEGGSRGQIEYDPVIKDELTGDKYKVTFFPDSSTELYSTFWKLEDVTKGTVVADSLKYYLYNTEKVNVSPTDGFIVRLSDEEPVLDTSLSYQVKNNWVDTAASVVHYLSVDINQHSNLENIGGNLSVLTGTYVTADRLRRVEIRFGETQKAYRYLNGFFGASNTQQKRFFKYAEAISSQDTLGKGAVGNWDAENDRPFGYVDVPFQVWVDDPNFGETRQMAVGFIEKRADLGGNPDGVWDPGTSLLLSGEYILIFDAPYDPNGGQRIYKGGPYLDPNAGYADLNGSTVANGAFYPIPPEATLTQDERNIAASPFFNTLYAVGIQKATNESTYTPGDKIVVNVDNYPYTTADVYEFETRKNGNLNADEEKALFNKVNVFPNPLYGFNPATSYTNSPPDEPFVTFSNLPRDVTVTIYSLSGNKLRTLSTGDKSLPSSPFLQWDLKNDAGIRAASGLYIAIVDSPKYGQKILKFSIIMPQKQLKKY